MPKSSNGWRELFESNGLAVLVFVSGTSLQALETFIGSAMLPTVTADIGGLDLFAWNTTIFIVASILATVFAAVRPARFDTRATYVLAAMGFALGSLICGLAPNMLVLLAGRAAQGFGAGLMIAMGYALIRLVFPQHLWPRAMALNSTVWGVATLTGPAIGGVFAELGLWRWAFLAIVPLAIALAMAVWRLLPAENSDHPKEDAPLVQIALVAAAIMAISTASLLTDNTPLAVTCLLAALAAVLLLAAAESRGRTRLLPEGALSLRTPIGVMFATILLLGLGITSDIFAPLLLQRLHGLSPLWAGYVAALVALGWSFAAFVSAGWTGNRIRLAILLSPWILTASTLLMLVSLGRYNADGDVASITIAGLALFAMGCGIGMAFQHLSTGVLAAVPAADGNRVSAGLGMVQLFASGLGAAIGGVIVNAAGLPRAATDAGVEPAATWLFAIFTVICILPIPLAWRVAGERAARLQAAE